MDLFLLKRRVEDIEEFRQNEIGYFLDLADYLSQELDVILGIQLDPKLDEGEIYHGTTSIVTSVKSRIQVVSAISDINKIKDFLVDVSDYSQVSTLMASLNEIENSLNSCFFDDTPARLVALASKMASFSIAFDTFCETYRGTFDLLTPEPNFEKSILSKLSIYLESEDKYYSEILTKLQAIQSLYSEVCQLLGVSEADFPLQVIKVETGSLWLLLLGKKEVFDFLRSSIKAATDYIYRNYTTEGKIASIPRAVESAEEILSLRKKLEESGIYSEELDEQIKKSAVTLAEGLNQVLSKQLCITVDNERHMLISRDDGRQLLGRRQPLLEASTSVMEQSEESEEDSGNVEF